MFSIKTIVKTILIEKYKPKKTAHFSMNDLYKSQP